MVADQHECGRMAQACSDFIVDVCSTDRLCRCGFPKSAHAGTEQRKRTLTKLQELRWLDTSWTDDHAKIALPVRGRRLSDTFIQQPQNGPDASNESGACEDFMIDPLSSARSCRCGFPKSAHSPTPQVVRERKYSDAVHALRQNFSGSQVPSFHSTHLHKSFDSPKSAYHLVSVFNRFEACRSNLPLPKRSCEEVACTESITCACGNELSVTKEELEILIRAMPDYESKTVAELIEFFSSLISSFGEAHSNTMAKSVPVEQLALTAPGELLTMCTARIDSWSEQEPIDSPRTPSSFQPSIRIGRKDFGDDEISTTTASDIAVSEDNVDGSTLAEMEIKSSPLKLYDSSADGLAIVDVDAVPLTRKEVNDDDALNSVSAFQKARAKWTEAAQAAAEEAAAERVAAEKHAAKLRQKEIDAAAAVRRREEAQAAKQREKELKTLDEERRKIEAEAEQKLAEAAQAAKERAELEQKAVKECAASSTATNADDDMVRERLEESQKKIRAETASKLVAAEQLVAQRQQNRLRRAAEREAEALRQAEAREQVARAKAADLARKRTLPISCRCGNDLMVTPEEMDALHKYVPDFASKTAEELAELLPKLHMGAWLNGSKHLFAKIAEEAKLPRSL